ncbi:MAG: TonB-dependent receptor [Bacteroidetes bacterium 4572_112]|nr:MAG: TonB-dependent receptor [Bacteroidetes bacterium 4572_112]
MYKQLSKLFLTLIAVIGLFSFSQAQTLKGKIVDAGTGEGLIGATVVVKGTTRGAATNLDGSFELNLNTGKYTLEFKYIGYKTEEKEVNTTTGKIFDIGVIKLTSNQIGIEGVNIITSYAVDRKTPVAVSTMKSIEINENLGSQELPEVLNRTPAVYATKGAGGYGDSRITIRGFDQRNIAIMINGIPVNDMENGWVYWSNWAGLGDAVSTMQVQRGLGASKLAINSVGGTMNIVTNTADAEQGGSIQSSITSYGTKKAMLNLNTGENKNGTALTFVGSRTSGPGYVDATYIDAWSYYLAISQKINDKHRLQFSIIGAPQKHGQRDNSKYSAQTYSNMEKNGITYNPNWGWLGGEMYNERNNFYHKPQMALNWYWTINKKAFLATSAYVSYGSGGGSGILGKGPIKYGAPSTALGQRDWQYAVNVNDTSTTGSYLIMRNSMNNHFWTGAISTLKYKLSDNLKLIAGIDVRHYKGEHYREVRDLLGGDYWVDKVTPEAQVGDRIAYDNDGLVTYGGAFAQLEYSMGDLDAFVAATTSNTWYNRVDRYNFARGRGELNAEQVTAFGYNAKAGANYNINEKHNVYVNAGYYSRAPYHNFVYVNYGNDINPDLDNEKILALEVGYGFTARKFTAKVNAYYTTWSDKWAKGSYRDTSGTSHTIYFQGISEVHSGLELEMKYKVTNNLELGAFGSIGDWHYTDDVNFDVYDDDRNIVGNYHAYIKDLKVADAPQTQFGLIGRYEIGNHIIIGADYIFNDNLYARFDPERRTDPTDTQQSYKLPSFGIINAMAKYKFKLGSLDSYFQLNAYNLTDKLYATEGWDNATKDSNGEYNHNQENFMGFWGFGRNFNLSLKVMF